VDMMWADWVDVLGTVLAVAGGVIVWLIIVVIVMDRLHESRESGRVELPSDDHTAARHDDQSARDERLTPVG
jgi:hypothetical protein